MTGPTNPRRISPAGLELIRDFEKCRLKAYPDPATGGKPWTCGWGSTGPDIGPHTVFTQDEADARLQAHLRDVEAAVSAAVKVRLSDNQFGALCSFAYNIGVSAFKNSTLVRKLNQSDYYGAADEINRWCYASGQLMPGLIRRRKAERELFLRKS